MSIRRRCSRFDEWFASIVGAPTAIQQQAWPIIREGRNALLLAPTGQGKSLAAWRPVIERLCAAGLADGKSPEGVRALHVAPLKALARDMTLNLAPLLEFASDLGGCRIEIALRCGDTPAAERARQRRRPPQIISTTPESLFVLLGSQGGRRLLAAVETVVIDELHALVSSKRGAHLALSLARLDRMASGPVQRIGLSATARPGDVLARFMTGEQDCAIIEPDPPKSIELKIELPDMELGVFPNSVHWQQIHARIAELAMSLPDMDLASDQIRNKASLDLAVAGRRRSSLLVFCQTRAQVERSAAALDKLLTEAGLPEQVGAHHGSLDRLHREGIEARFKVGSLRVMVSSASLELGLDLGHVDRVCQLGVPGSVNIVRQRAGRSEHRPSGLPCMHVFPLTLNQLVEARAVADAISGGIVEAAGVPDGPLDVLAQHLVAMAAAEIMSPGEMLELARAAWPYRRLEIKSLQRLLDLLSEPVPKLPDRQSIPLLVRQRQGSISARAHTQRLVLTNAGTIPEFFEYEVVRADTGQQVGTLDEEFAFESSPGQVVQLGRRAWRILRVLTGQVRVEPADGEAAELPFWFGEGPGRTPELACAMIEAMARCNSAGLEPQASRMLAESRRVLGALPSLDRLVIERFPDPNGDRHIVLHTFAGARINRAWGLALRKRFCRQFNFELQAAATDDGILISLGVTSCFEPAEVTGFVRADNVADILTQALLDTPMFLTRFRWVANNALVLLKNDLQGSVPAQRQRSQAENLIACVFPDQLACLENLSGPRQVPDHPLVQQALGDCLNDYMDLDGLKRLLARIECGEVEVNAVETDQPSPLAGALIHAPRHSYLDDAAAEERRTRNFESAATGARSHIGFPTGPKHARLFRSRKPAHDTHSMENPGHSHHAIPLVWQRDSGAWRRVRTSQTSGVSGIPSSDSLPAKRTGYRGEMTVFARRPSPDNLEQLLLECGFLTVSEGEAGLGLARPVAPGGWTRAFSTLLRERRALACRASTSHPWLWVALDHLGTWTELLPELEFRPWISVSLVSEPVGDDKTLQRWLLHARRRIDGEGAADAVRRCSGLHLAGVA